MRRVARRSAPARAYPFGRYVRTASSLAGAIVRKGPSILRAYRAGKNMLKRKGKSPSKAYKRRKLTEVTEKQYAVQKDIKIVRMGTIRLPGLASPPRSLRQLGKIEYHRQYQGSVTNAEGLEGYMTAWDELKTADFLTGSGSGAGYFSMNPVYSYGSTTDVTVSTVVPYAVGASAIQRTHRMFYSGFNGFTTFVNLSVIPTVVHVLFVTRKTNGVKGGDQLWTDYISKEGQMDLVTAVHPTSGGPALAAGAPNVLDFGNLPTQCREFTRDVRVLRHAKFELDGGSSKRLEYFFKFNRLLAEERIKEIADEGNTRIRFLNIQCMVITQPGVVDETKGGGTNLTYGTAKIGFVAENKHYFRFMECSPNIKYFVPAVRAETAALAQKTQSYTDTSIDPAGAGNVS